MRFRATINQTIKLVGFTFGGEASPLYFTTVMFVYMPRLVVFGVVIFTDEQSDPEIYRVRIRRNPRR